MIRSLPVSIVGLLIWYAVPCYAHSPARSEDEEAIKNVLAGTTEAFNKHDAKAFARFYTPDAELVTVRGERMKGAAEIEKGLAAIFATRATAATLKMLDLSIRFIKPDVAIAHVTNEMSGVVNTDARPGYDWRWPAPGGLRLLSEISPWNLTMIVITRYSLISKSSGPLPRKRSQL
jgi:uncharacterized protein (TIGR02246 family)